MKYERAETSEVNITVPNFIGHLHAPDLKKANRKCYCVMRQERKDV